MSTYDPTLMNTNAIRDDNLRLILARDHDQWLAEEWRYHQIWLCLAAGLLALTIMGILAQITLFLIFGILSPIWIILLIKALYEMRCVRAWQRDHYNFLASYNRAHLSSFMPA